MTPQIKKSRAPLMWAIGAAIAALVFFAGRPLMVAAQQPDMAARIAALEAGQREILKQLQEIKTLLQSRPPAAQAQAAPAPAQPTAPQDFALSIDGAATKGRADAKVVIVEFSDFECPFCGRYSRDTFPSLDRDYVATGKVRYVFRHFPLTIHRQALKAAEAGECARLQGKFWPIHDRFFANQQLLAPSALVDHASAVGLNAMSFQSCLNGQATARVREDLATGSQLAITGTPTFFVGVPQKDGKVHVTQRIVGAKGAVIFQGVFDKLLAEAGK